MAEAEEAAVQLWSTSAAAAAMAAAADAMVAVDQAITQEAQTLRAAEEQKIAEEAEDRGKVTVEAAEHLPPAPEEVPSPSSAADLSAAELLLASGDEGEDGGERTGALEGLDEEDADGEDDHEELEEMEADGETGADGEEEEEQQAQVDIWIAPEEPEADDIEELSESELAIHAQPPGVTCVSPSNDTGKPPLPLSNRTRSDRRRPSRPDDDAAPKAGHSGLPVLDWDEAQKLSLNSLTPQHSEPRQRGLDDCGCLLFVPPRAAATFAATSAFVASVIVLHEMGPGDGSHFDADVTAFFVVLSTGAPALLIFLLQLTIACITGAKIDTMEWLLIVSTWLQAMGVVMSMLAMLAHATWLLVQTLAVVAALCWVLWCSSFSLWLWRKGVPTPPDGEPPLGSLLLVLPRRSFFAFWLITLALEVGTMYFKERKHLSFTEDLGIFEILLYYSLGGLIISFVMVAFLLSAFPMGRRLLRFRRQPGCGWQPVQGVVQVVWRALVVSFLLHLYAAMFLSVLVYALLAAVVLLIARMALPSQDDEPPWRCCSKRRKSAPVAPISSPISGEQSMRSLSASSTPDTALEIEEKEANERIESLRKHQPKDVVKQMWSSSATIMMICLGLAKVLVLVIIFCFDIVFLERYLADSASRNYVLVRSQGRCGARGELISSFTMSAKECALYVGMKAPGFLYEPSGNVATPGNCYLAEDIIVSDALYSDYTNGILECPSGNFTDDPGLDFYVLEPSQDCENKGRFLANLEPAEGEEQHTTQPSHRYMMPKLVPEAFGVLFGDRTREVADYIMWAFRYVVTPKFFIPQAVSIQCAGLRRLAAGCMILGAVLALLAVQALDLFSIMAASKEIAVSRAKSRSSFLVYMLAVAKATALEQAVVMTLQLTVSAGVAAKQEGIGFFHEECGNLVTEDHLAGSSCPVFWHIPIDVVASLLLFCSLFFLVMVVLGSFGGAFYGLEPARWAMNALFGSHLQMAVYLPKGEDQLRTLPSRVHERTERPGCCRRCCRFLLRALAALPATLGVYFQQPTRVYQVKERQEWYEPVQLHSDEDEPEVKQDLVSWKAMFGATARSIAIAWLPVGRMGPLLSKACLAFNEYVIFAYGKDTSEEGKQLYDHFRQDRSRMAQVIYWGTFVAQFVVIVIIEFDFLIGVDEEIRIYVLAGLLGFVICTCMLRACFDLIEDMLMWARTRNTIDWCAAMVVGATPSRVLKASNGIRQWENDDENPLDGLCDHKREEVIQVCRDLLELNWVRSCTFLSSKRVLLDATDKRQGLRGYSARRMLKLFNSQKGSVTEGMVTASMLIYFRVCLDQEICIARARRTAEQMAYAHWLAEAKLRSAELARWAVDRARAQALELAKARLKAFADYREATGAKDTIWPASCPRELHLCYSATFGGVIRGTGQWNETDRDLMPRIEERASVRSSGEVVIEWPRNQKPGNLSIGQVRVKQTNTQFLDDNVSKWGEEASGPNLTGPDAAPPWPSTPLKTKSAINIEKLRLQCVAALQSAKTTGSLENAIKEFEAEEQVLDAPIVDEDHCWLTQWEQALKAKRRGIRGCCMRGSLGPNALKSGETRMLDQTERWRVQVAVDWDGIGGPWTSNPRVPGKNGGNGSFFASVDEDAEEHYDNFHVDDEDRLQDPRLANIFGWSFSSFPPEPDWTASTADETLQKHEDMQDMQEWIQRTPNSPRLLYIAHIFLNRVSCFQRVAPTEMESAAQTRKASQYALLLAFHVELVRRRRKRKELEAKFQPREEVPVTTTVVGGPLIVKQASSSSKLGGLFKASKSLSKQSSAAGMPDAGPVEELREALARDPLDADELQAAIEVARRSDVDPVFLQRAEEELASLLERQAAAMKLVEAIHCRTIGKLREGIGEAKKLGFEDQDFPDAKGRGILFKANAVLHEEEKSARQQLKEALAKGGVVKLQRAVEQARAANIEGRLLKEAEQKLTSIGAKKQRIALLKIALTSNNYSLLRDVVAQCEEAGDEDVDLRQARRRLMVLEAANRSFQEGMKRAHERDGDIAAALVEVCADEGEQRSTSPEEQRQLDPASRKVTLEELQGVEPQAMRSVRDLSLTDINSTHSAATRVRAVSSLKAALFQEPLNLGILRMAVAQAEAVGVKNVDLNQAKELLSIEEAKGDVVERLHKCSSVRDVAGLKEALRECKKVRVEDSKILAVLTQLFNDQARIARLAGDHGLSNIFLHQIEQERCLLHNRIQEASGGLRVFCRIRPLGHLEGQIPLVIRQDRHTIVVKSPEQVASDMSGGGTPTSKLINRGMTMGLSSSRAGKSNVGQSQEQSFRFNVVFGPDAIQAEVFDELKGLCQSAVDGYNVLLVGCGPAGGGKTYTMMGSSQSNQKRGIAPRIADEVFAIRDRDEWRASLVVEVQAVEVLDHKEIVDLLGVEQHGRQRVTVRVVSADEAGRPSTAAGPMGRAAPLGSAGPPSAGGTGSGLQVRTSRGGNHLQFAGAAAMLPRHNPLPNERPGSLGLPGAGVAAGNSVSASPPSSRSSARPRSAAACHVELDASFHQVASHLDLRAVIEQAFRSRTCGGRSRRAHESKSHFVVFIHLTRTNKATGATTRSRIVMADMAGMSSGSSLEVMSAYQAVESVMNALSHRSRMVPFREHALTQCFQDCMGGSSKTVMMLELPPDAGGVTDTLRAIQSVTA